MNKKTNKTLADYPALLLEFDYDKNEEAPENIHHGSTKKVWWVCSHGHKWKTQVRYRVPDKAPNRRPHGCPVCKMPFSSLEVMLYSVMNTIVDCKWRTKVIGFEVDVLIPCFMLAIEIDGAYWHKDKTDSDKRKTVALESEGYKVIRLREKPLPVMSDCDMLYNYKDDERIVVSRFVRLLGDICGVQMEADWKEAFVVYGGIKRATTDPAKTVLCLFPKLAIEWSTKNVVSPDSVSYGSKMKVWWICENGHEWRASVQNRTMRNSGCPYCNGRLPHEGSNLAVSFPNIASEWAQYDITPYDVRPKSHMEVNWNCGRCGSKYRATVADRVRGRGCPHCRYERMAETRRKTNAVQSR